MKDFVLFCKSYATDLKRVVRLAHSIQKYNTNKIPFFVAVPLKDHSLFKEHLQNFSVFLITDEDIIAASSTIDAEKFSSVGGSLAQQVVKSEFWRLGIAESYLCLDSDSLFIRPFDENDFVDPSGTPYFVINECHDLLDISLAQKKSSVLENYFRESKQVQSIFGRQGKNYNFGPFPLVWHRQVWADLEANFLRPKDMNLLDALQQVPLESRWYGEALLKYKSVDILPAEPFFKVYHYAWQHDADKRNSINEQSLAKIYSGVIYQSSWERDMDWPCEGGNLLSRLARRLRRVLGRV